MCTLILLLIWFSKNQAHDVMKPLDWVYLVSCLSVDLSWGYFVFSPLV